jgi:hypothetical protein
MLGRGAHSELVHICLAHHHNAYLIEALHHRCIVCWLEVFQHTGAAGGRDTFGADHIFDRDRNTRQRGKMVSAGKTLVCFLSLLQSQFIRHECKCTYLRLNGTDAFKMGLRQFDRGDFLLTQ